MNILLILLFIASIIATSSGITYGIMKSLEKPSPTCPPAICEVCKPCLCPPCDYKCPGCPAPPACPVCPALPVSK